MLREVRLKNFAVVESVVAPFAAGLNVLTGETGAGKSILLDALGLALGGRADSGVVRANRERADIAAEFDLAQDGPLYNWLQEQALPAEDGAIILRRTVDAGGRSRAWTRSPPRNVSSSALRESRS